MAPLAPLTRVDDLSVSGPIQPPATDDHTGRRPPDRKRERPRPPRRKPGEGGAAAREDRPVAPRHEGNLDVLA